jgi:hypothetical protein
MTASKYLGFLIVCIPVLTAIYLMARSAGWRLTLGFWGFAVLAGLLFWASALLVSGRWVPL